LVFGGMRFAPGFWAGFALLLVVHEVGHAVLVRLYGYSVLSIDLTGIGGLCRWSGFPTQAQRSAIAWGGVVGQLFLLLPAAIASFVLSPSWILADFLYALTWSNLLLIGLNLLPVPMFDGAEAWKLFRIPGGLGSAIPRRRSHGTRRRESGTRGAAQGWFPRGVGAAGKRKRKSRRGAHLRDVSLDRNEPSEQVASELLRIAEEARKARDRLN